MMITIYHNPRCSKSRETLALVESLNTTGAPLNVVEYLKTPPTVEELEALHRQLGRPVRDMLRDGEEPYKALNLARVDLTDADAYAAIAAHPILLQRPIVVYRGKAAVGRPPESVQALFE
ncbi:MULTISPECIES: arsenate reductase (glutaredoxin) [Burkholderia]|jgi:arsenate reductase (glutaredoxin)|uniref:Arsenate reductase n=3 Tax=Bacteria TaxID=2 RepID=A0A1E3FHQ8_9BURK|nr:MULTISPECIES: arsenate reductase (glutaredoxin) [Burkholderia]UTP24370.1 arsenate reductase (glutaredoxin) [Burkholderia sp. FXe9]KKL31947.1 arsenate reductase [Burkholderia contaminans LMG 23361]MBA9830228.1 arsenate reductase (glutaredoxin) [Burkholderia contaminans]MBA9839771.1 arsenate reductase (glutaredoxin) [Burkholderia contaminans]MBA9862843.1 arsenate reductase (glutaredoxin) [Burkholderia contaminans]